MKSCDIPDTARNDWDVVMGESGFEGQIIDFDKTIGNALQPVECWKALQGLANAMVEFKLFTIMTVDMKKQEACRVYTSHPVEYPVSGIKPIHYDDWFEIVHRQQKSFVANTIADIARVFPDHEKIWSMGCGSVINLPVVISSSLVATVNILHVEHYFSHDRVALIEKYLSKPAVRAYLAASGLQADSGII